MPDEDVVAPGNQKEIDLTEAAIEKEIENIISKKQSFGISLAEWSLHREIFNKKIDHLDFPEISVKNFGINTVEYVNQFFMDKAENTSYLNKMLRRCENNNVTGHLIMVDNEGSLADLNKTTRKKAVENHYKWIDAAKYLGCKSVRVNVHGTGSVEDVKIAAIDALGTLCEYAAPSGINVIVENHGGYSSDSEWLTAIITQVNSDNAGTLPDFGNFCLHHQNDKCIEEYDRYKGVREMMPYAKAVSAKTLDFDAAGNCVETDYHKMLTIVKVSGFNGYIGIEYGGGKMSEHEGVLKTKALLQKTASQINYTIT